MRDSKAGKVDSNSVHDRTWKEYKQKVNPSPLDYKP